MCRPILAVLVAVVCATSTVAGAECLSGADERGGRPDAGMGSVVFPRDDVFRAPLADPKEPRFSASYQRVRFRTGQVTAAHPDETLHMGFVSAGTTLGLWSRRRDGCDGIQVGILGGVFSQFDLDRSSGDLVNSDFLVGVPVTGRSGRWSGRARLLHQSSHLGDEFLVRNRAIRVRNFGFEMVDLLVSYDFDRLRIYGGAGVVFNSSTSFAPGVFQAGAELRPRWNTAWRPFTLVPSLLVAVDFKSWEEQGWGATWNAVAGFEFQPPGRTPRLRLVATAMSGHFPFAQFFAETRADAVGLAAQFDIQ